MVQNCQYFLFDYIPSAYFLIIASLILFNIWFFRQKSISWIAYFLVVGGSLWNLSERIMNKGCVRDYWDFFGLFIFNAADLMIIFGLVIVFCLHNKKSVLFTKEDLS